MPVGAVGAQYAQALKAQRMADEGVSPVLRNGEATQVAALSISYVWGFLIHSGELRPCYTHLRPPRCGATHLN